MRFYVSAEKNKTELSLQRSKLTDLSSKLSFKHQQILVFMSQDLFQSPLLPHTFSTVVTQFVETRSGLDLHTPTVYFSA